MGLRSLFQGEIYLYIFIHIYVIIVNAMECGGTQNLHLPLSLMVLSGEALELSVHSLMPRWTINKYKKFLMSILFVSCSK